MKNTPVDLPWRINDPCCNV